MPMIGHEHREAFRKGPVTDPQPARDDVGAPPPPPERVEQLLSQPRRAPYVPADPQPARDVIVRFLIAGVAVVVLVVVMFAAAGQL